MKKIFCVLLFLLLPIVTMLSQTDFSTYNETNRLPYAFGGGYYRIDYQWYLRNTQQPSVLYLNNSITTIDSGGNADTKYFDALDSGLISENVNEIKLGIIDTGIYAAHPDFQGITFSGKNFITNQSSTDLSDSAGHGTRVSGIILAKNNNVGIRGMVNITNVIITKVSFNLRQEYEMVNAIYYCVTNGVKIINMSGGTPSYNGLSNLSNAVYYAWKNGVIIVCAVPNVDQNIDVVKDYPTSWHFDNVVSVTGIFRTGTKFFPVAWGRNSVHLAAPARVIATTLSNPSVPYGYDSGTSMATPMVTSALLLIADKYPYQSYKYWIERLVKGVTPQNDLSNITISKGRLNFFNSLSNDIPRLEISNYENVITLSIHSEFTNGMYVIQYTENFNIWENLCILKSDENCQFTITNPHLFFRTFPVNFYISPSIISTNVLEIPLDTNDLTVNNSEVHTRVNFRNRLKMININLRNRKIEEEPFNSYLDPSSP